MAAFIRWRVQLRRGEPPDTSRARTFYVLNHAEMGIVVVMVFAASFLARGFGQR